MVKRNLHSGARTIVEQMARSMTDMPQVSDQLAKETMKRLRSQTFVDGGCDFAEWLRCIMYQVFSDKIATSENIELPGSRKFPPVWTPATPDKVYEVCQMVRRYSYTSDDIRLLHRDKVDEMRRNVERGHAPEFDGMST